MSTLISAVTFFPRLAVAVPSYALSVAFGSKSQEQLSVAGSDHLNGVLVDDAQGSPEEDTERKSNPHAVETEEHTKSNARVVAEESESESYLFSWLNRRWSTLKEKNLKDVLHDGGCGEQILERYLQDQIAVLEEEGAERSDAVAAQQESPSTQHHEEEENSLVYPCRDSVSSGALGLHSEFDYCHELYELRESQQQYEQAWWDYGLKLCSLGQSSWHDPLVSFSVRAPLLNVHVHVELNHGTQNMVNPPLISLWNFGLNLNLVQQKDKSLIRQDEEC